MKRKTTSYGDMLKTVGAVVHPLLEAHHRELLYKLAIFANQNGRDIRPTYAYLRAGTNHTDEYIRQLLKHLRVTCGLIERTHKGQGKGNASVFRICLENPAFPDDYPTRTVTPTDDEKLTPTGKQVTPTEPAVYPNSQATLPQLESDFTPTTELQPSFALPKTPPHPPPETQKVSSEKRSAQVIVAMPQGWGDSPSLAAMGFYDDRQAKQLAALARPYGEHGWKVVKFAVLKWADARPQGLFGLKQPWHFFFKECSADRIKQFVKDNHELSMMVIPGYAERWKFWEEKTALFMCLQWTYFSDEHKAEMSDVEKSLWQRGLKHDLSITRDEYTVLRALCDEGQRRWDLQKDNEKKTEVEIENSDEIIHDLFGKPATPDGDSEEGLQ